MEHTFHLNQARTLSIILVSILAIGLVGCSKATPSPTLTEPPVISPTPTMTLIPTLPPTDTPVPTPTFTPCIPPEVPILDPAGEVSVQPDSKLPIRATSPNAQAFTWEFTGDGELSSTTADVTTYTAPATSGGLATVTVRANNSCGESPSASLIIHISNVIKPIDQIGVPEAWMTNGRNNPADYITMQIVSDGCYTSKCYQFSYKPGNVWAGILWWPKGCNWNSAKAGTCGIMIFDQNDIIPENLTFWAKGEKGGEILEFMVGATDIQPSPAESTGQIALGSGWQKVEIPLTSMDMNEAIALFTWVAADIGNKEPITFYLDGIQFEGSK